MLSLRRVSLVLSLVVSALAPASGGCGPGPTGAPLGPPQPAPPLAAPPPAAAHYRATIRRTQYGVPHVLAADVAGAGFGQGYAFAEDHACTLLDQIIKVRSERARYFGPGPDGANLASDLGYLALEVRERALKSLQGLPPDAQALFRGFAAGVNHFLAEAAARGQPLRGGTGDAAWHKALASIKSIDEHDLAAYYQSMAFAASGSQLLGAMAAASPPGAPALGLALPPPAPLRPPSGVGSNGWAIGAERTLSGRGMLVANPHQPWEGELRFWESHLTVPGTLNVYGVSPLGLPGVSIGFNENVAWTHTFFERPAMTLYALHLVPGKPTQYLYDGKPRAMIAREVALSVLQPDGSVREIKRTLYRSHHGPMLALPNIGWSNELAVAYRDANADNETMMAQYDAMDRARDLGDFQRAFAELKGIPWMHTLAADRAGDAWYVNGAPVPNLSPRTLERWQKALVAKEPLTKGLFDALSVLILDGSTSEDEWVAEPGARGPGLIPYARAPKLARRDFVFNANDSHWLANPGAPLSGFSPLYGEERTPQFARTRLNARLLSDLGPAGASGPDGKFTRAEVEAALLDERSLPAELLRAKVVERCQAKKTARVEGKAVDLTKACSVLARWNGKFDLESVGAVLFREFLGRAPRPETLDAGRLYAVGFSPTSPVATPHSLKPAPAKGDDPVLTWLAEAVLVLKKANIEVDQPLGEVQFAVRGGKKVPVPGGIGRDGVLNLAQYEASSSTLEPPTPRGELLSMTGLTRDGYPINIGATLLMVAEFAERGVKGEAILTYGQSEDPGSPHFADQMELYRSKTWRKIAFSEEDIKADPTLTEQVVETR